MEKTKIKAFTLIELLIVITIIGVMTGVTIFSMGSSRKHTALRAAQAEVASAIKQAQSYALQGKIPASEMAPGMPGVCGYGFRFSNKNVFEIFYYRKVDTGGGFICLDLSHPSFRNGLITVERKNLKDIYGKLQLSLPNINASNWEPSAVLFDIPHGNASFLTSPISYTIKVEDAAETKTVTINSGGLVVEGP